jgi:hypothetical protein
MTLRRFIDPQNGDTLLTADVIAQALAGTPAQFTPVGAVATTIIETGIVAAAGGDQTTATPLTSAINRVDTVATEADAVGLPKITDQSGVLGSLGTLMLVANNDGDAMQVFGAPLDTINGVTSATGVPVAAGVNVWFAAVSYDPTTGVGAWLMTNSQAAAVAAITSGTIDGVTIDDSVIGGDTPAEGSFTYMNADVARVGDVQGTDDALNILGLDASDDDGGEVALVGGSSTQAGGAGGLARVAAGNAGAGGAGGNAGVSASNGGAGATTVPGGAGGNVELVAGTGGSKAGAGEAEGGDGGDAGVTAGAGGHTASAGSDDGGDGGLASVTAGAGGNATAGTGDGGDGGSVVLTPGAGGTSAGGAAGVKGGVVAQGRVFELQGAPAAKTTTTTLSAAEVVGGMITANPGASTPANYTFPTGALLAAALPSEAAVGYAFMFYATNISTDASEDVTFIGGDGTTLIGSGAMASNAAATDKSSASFRIRRTGAATFDIFRV